MTKTELESKHLSDLHQLAADAGVERYRMLSRAELIERLSDGEGGGSASRGAGGSGSGRASGDRKRGESERGGRKRAEGGDRKRRERGGSERGGGKGGESDREESEGGDGERSERPRRRRRRSGSGGDAAGREREARVDVEEEEEKLPESSLPERAPTPIVPSRDEEGEGEGSRPRRRRRRRRPFGRRREGVSIQDLLLPAEAGRQAVLLADSRQAATDLLRGVAADLAGASDGPDPVVLLIDPSPEELADWKREAPQAELVSAGQARHASDALAAAQRRSADGEDVILLIDSLTRFAESFGDADGAKELFDAGRGNAGGKGTLTVVAALERQ